MILQRLKAFIEEHPGCTLRQLASHFRLSEDAAAAMLQSCWESLRNGSPTPSATRSFGHPVEIPYE